ncbi:MAG: DUF4432 family protein [Candidatus Latescibacteria bacterium]|nr:DUF4432 family protein [Candidatus Latescibacterota bacterium]
MEGIYRYVLTDVEQNLWYESWTVDEATLPLGAGSTWSVRKTTLRGGLQDGVDLIEVDNGALSFFVVPTRGMGIWKGIYRGIPLGWESPARDLVNPAFVDANDRGGLGWLKGFNEWVVRCGLESNGAPSEDVVIDNNGNEAKVFLPLHGKIANIPARHVEARVELSPPHRLTVMGIVEETMMFGPALRLTTSISTTLGSNALTICDEVTNLNRRPAELELLYHCNYGPPLLEEGSALVTPFKTVCPRDSRAQEGIGVYDRFSGPEPGYVEQCYFFELAGRRRSEETCVLLKNRDGSIGSSLHFSLKQMPCFTLWKNTAATEDGYVIGLEPATNYPNAKRFERKRGRVVVLGGGETRRIDLTVAVHDKRQEVEAMERLVRRVQKDVRPKVSRQVLKRLSSEG